MERTVELRVPPKTTGLLWAVFTTGRERPRGRIEFVVLPPAEVAVVPARAQRRETIEVRFRALGGVLAGCRAGFAFTKERTACEGAGRSWVARLAVPEDAPPGPTGVEWAVWQDDKQVEIPGTTPFEVVRPVAPPPPVFRVEPVPATAEPGQDIAIRFASDTTGVTIKTCEVVVSDVLHPCDGELTATVPVPLGQPVGPMPVLWRVTYSSERPEEPKSDDEGLIAVQVEIVEPTFEVLVTPSTALPGDPVTVVFTPVTEGVRILGCLAAFPNDAGDECRQSEDRWLAEVTVPSDARPGWNNLRWGVQAAAATGRPIAQSSTIRYRVSPKVAPPLETTTTTAPSRPVKEQQVGPEEELDLGPVPKFVAAAQPESAVAGEQVTVSVSPVEPGAEITDCLVTFPGDAGVQCEYAGGRWSATVTVPAGTAAGAMPLRWGVTSRTADGRRGADNGIVNYPVRAPGSPLPPAFDVRPEPAAGRSGDRVTVSMLSLVEGTAVTGCAVGFDEGSLAACHPAAKGWAADLVVPEGAKAGPGTLLWRVAYKRTGRPGAADGLLTFTVLPPEVVRAGFPGNLLPI
ncbi:hypothetical protein AB0M20_37310, partial [Actinoplanes sp. NPDC051633]|uniref:hypothetical protein n=1 Tax=Actinoplanes sp. NPDC051633 TaxID=3155670 RepID=UPI0034211C8E